MSGARKALQAAIDAYHRKAMDMSSPTPTEEYEAGGGAIGYAEQAIDAAGLAILPKVAEGVEEARAVRRRCLLRPRVEPFAAT